jgi:hypothetical protein
MAPADAIDEILALEEANRKYQDQVNRIKQGFHFEEPESN